MTTKTFYNVLLSFILLSLLYLPNVHGQSKNQILNLELEAKTYFDNLVFDEALQRYLKLDSIRPDHPDYIYKIGICYIHTYDHEKALPYLEKCTKAPEKYPMALFYYLGRAYHLSNRFDEAMVNYGKYREYFALKGNNKHHNKLVEDVDREIQMCYNGKELVKNPIQVEITNLGPVVNTKYPEYAPTLNAEENVLIFTSNRPNTTGGKIDHHTDGEFYEDIYISVKTANGWSEPKHLSDSINTEAHDASIFLSADGQTLLLYRTSKDNLMDNASGNLYISTLKGNNWTKAVKLSANINSDGWEPSACISQDGKTIIFSSNREGGSGGTDLYISTKNDKGEWSVATGLSPNINTIYDEDAPFLHPDGKILYFCSKGHNSMGGFDIFKSTYDEQSKSWSKPVNVGYPLSTSHDDLHFSWSADETRAYFSTVKAGGYGDQDLYFAQISSVEKKESKVALVKGKITDSTDKALMAKIKVVQIIQENDLVTQNVGEFESNSETGHFSFVLDEGRKYLITVEAENFQSINKTIDLTTDSGYEQLEMVLKLSRK